MEQKRQKWVWIGLIVLVLAAVFAVGSITIDAVDETQAESVAVEPVEGDPNVAPNPESDAPIGETQGPYRPPN